MNQTTQAQAMGIPDINKTDELIENHEIKSNSNFLSNEEQVRIASQFSEKFYHYNVEISSDLPKIKGGVLLFKSRFGTSKRKDIADYENLERFIPTELRARKSDTEFTVFLYAEKKCQHFIYGSDERGEYYYLPIWENYEGKRVMGRTCTVSIMGFYWPEDKIIGAWELFIKPNETEPESNIVNGAFTGDEMITDWLRKSALE